MTLPRLTSHFRERADVPPWQWCAENVDYSRAANYDTPYRGPFDPDLMPFWKEPLEKARDSGVREIVVVKCARGGYSENFLLSDLRYTVAVAPEPTLYVTGKMDLAKGFLDRRVTRGMRLAAILHEKFKAARTVGTDIQFADMDFRVTWSTSDTATKQDGWARIHADEVSLWAEFTVDMVRRRCAAYPFHHIIFGGSIDPTRKGRPEEDPTLKLYEESDRGVWMMPAPGKGHPLFAWRLDGVKWPEAAKDGDEWDLNRVAAEAWYETPNGKRIEEADRMDIVREGQWGHRNPDGIRTGYKVVSAMVPFVDCSFGELARRFLSAKHRMNLTGSRQDRQRNTLRTYFADNWAEAHQDEELVARDTTLAQRESDYELGDFSIIKDRPVYAIMTCDVQKLEIWWDLRIWSRMAESGEVISELLDYGRIVSLEEIGEKARDLRLNRVGVDIGYKERAVEVGRYCSRFTSRYEPERDAVYALRGSETMSKSIPLDIKRNVDALEGLRQKGREPFVEITFQTDVFRTMFMECLLGAGSCDWVVPSLRADENKWRREYVKQVTSTKKVDGQWPKPGHGQDHLFDCETMQMVLACHKGLVA